MESARFDELTKALSLAGPRRGMVRLLATLPLAGVLMRFFDQEESPAKRRQKNEKPKGRKRNVGGENHKHEHRRRKHRNKRNNHHHDKKTCKPRPTAQTCDGKCGPVRNNCKKTVDCGSCDCVPDCPICQRCDVATTACLPDPAQVGDPCGDGLVCQDDGSCACQGDSCGGCRACEGGACVIDTSVVCSPLDQCHDAGVCDPETGECTNPRKGDGTSCDAGDPCSTNDICQNGVCTGGTIRDCSVEADICNDGVCRADGSCGKRPKSDGTSCNADNTDCTSGDSCQNGVCTAGAGIDCSAEDDECNSGVCRQSDGECVKDSLPDGTPCGSNGECVSGSCEEVVCLALRDSCDPNDNQCCDADCAVSSNCQQTGNRCCHRPQGACGNECDCCGTGICEGNACCHHTGGSCETAADCCQDFFNLQSCVSGRCCALPDQPCEGPDDCCEGLCHPDGFCTSCLGAGQICEEARECCQSGGVANCEPTCDFDNPVCCHPANGVCETNCDCCGARPCNDGRCCTLLGQICVGADECNCGAEPRDCFRESVSGEEVCCVPVGGACSATDSHCCGIDFGTVPSGPVFDSDVPCVSGVCCQQGGDPCRTVDDCCQSGVPLQCQPGGDLDCAPDPLNVCCQADGTPCVGVCECCSGFCVDGLCSTECKPDGTACDVDAECCSHICSGGVCQPQQGG